MPQNAAGFSPQPGHLYVCATPIGNLADLPPRVGRVLAAAHLVLAEDTRRTRKLGTRYAIKGRVISCHAHNEMERVDQVVAACQKGQIVALVTDAGTPGLSDPGSRLVAAVAASGCHVLPIPGPSAVAAALSVCGFPADSFQFLGFFPRQKRQQRRLIEAMAFSPAAMVTVFFESPNRIATTLELLAAAFPQRWAFVAREMTKKHESYYRGTLTDLAQQLGGKGQKGEFTLVLGPGPAATEASLPLDGTILAQEVQLLTKAGLPELEAIRRVARGHDLPRQAVYRLVRGG